MFAVYCFFIDAIYPNYTYRFKKILQSYFSEKAVYIKNNNTMGLLKPIT